MISNYENICPNIVWSDITSWHYSKDIIGHMYKVIKLDEIKHYFNFGHMVDLMIKKNNGQVAKHI